VFPNLFAHIHPIAVVTTVSILCAGSLLAVISGSRDGGLLSSCLLVTTPFSSWLVLYYFDAARPASTVILVAILSVLVGPIVGTVSHAVGQLLRTRRTGDEWQDTIGPVVETIVGPTAKRTGYWALFAGILLISATVVVVSRLAPVSVFLPVGAMGESPLLGGIVTGVYVGLTAIPGYRDEGLLSSWLLLFGPVFVGVTAEAVVDQFGSVPILVDAATYGIYGLVLALTVGTSGYVFGSISAG
jgi:hypothetical protein